MFPDLNHTTCEGEAFPSCRKCGATMLRHDVLYFMGYPTRYEDEAAFIFDDGCWWGYHGPTLLHTQAAAADPTICCVCRCEEDDMRDAMRRSASVDIC